jgi:hypothetical protein
VQFLQARRQIAQADPLVPGADQGAGRLLEQLASLLQRDPPSGGAEHGDQCISQVAGELTPSRRAVGDQGQRLFQVGHRFFKEIQQVPGFEDFLATPTFDDVAQAAEVQPLAYIAAAEQGGLAIVVRENSVTQIDLPDLASEPVDACARSHPGYGRG